MMQSRLPICTPPPLPLAVLGSVWPVVDNLGATIKAGGDVLLEGKNVTVGALIDQTSSHQEEHRSGYNRVTEVSNQSLSGGEVSAGGKLDITATGGNVALQSATLTAAGNVNLAAVGGNIELLDQQLQASRHEEVTTKSSGWFSSKTSNSHVSAGNKLTLESGGDP